MRIIKLNSIETKNLHNDGLGHVEMDRLKKIVLIAGPNGSGKSRLLERLTRIVPNAIKEAKRKELFPQVSNQSSYVVHAELSHLDNIHMIAPDKSVIKFAPKKLNLVSSNSDSPDAFLKRAKEMDDAIGIDHVADTALAKIQHLQNQLWTVTHQDYLENSSDKEAAQRDIQEVRDQYEKLQKYLESFLGAKLGRNKDGAATLFGFKLDEAKLSEGQRVLLQFCLAIYAQSTSLQSLILCMDEPENHLHPAVLIDTVKKITDSITDGQVWIATHSIHLLSHYARDEEASLWFMQNGKVKKAGKTPEEVLETLMGGKDEVSKLYGFLHLPAQYAAIEYARECLLPPQAVNTDNGDPQIQQIHKCLGNSSKRVLDYGAGKGRLALSLYEEDKTPNTLDYFAFASSDDDREDCLSAIKKIYGDNAESRYFNSTNELTAASEKEKFDVVIFCNVLHEIDPKEWLDLFEKVRLLLKDSGHVLVVEDQHIPRGEKAYENGFLILDVESIKALFEIDECVDKYIVDERLDGRLKAHLIPAQVLSRRSQRSLIAAIQKAKDQAQKSIRLSRSGEASFKNGLLHALHCQQYVNASFSLETLGG